MSSLKKQLTLLKSKEVNQETNANKIQAPTLIFSEKFSSSLSPEIIQSLAINGFQSLSQLDGRFHSYQDLIYKDRVDRSTLTQQQNEDLSAELKNLMLLLSLYLMSQDAQKILDLLLRNYLVHVYEGEQLVIYFMHYHLCDIYLKLIHSIPLENNLHLKFILKNKELLTMKTLSKQCIADPHLLKLLIKYNRDIEQIKEGQDIHIQVLKQNSNIQVTPLSFLASLILNILEIKKTNENFMKTIINCCAQFYASKSAPSNAFSLIVLTGLIEKEKNKISDQVIATFFDYSLKKLGETQATMAFKFLVYLIQRGYHTEIDKKGLQRLQDFYEQNQDFVSNFFDSYSSLQFFYFVAKGMLSQQEDKLDLLIKLGEKVKEKDKIFEQNPEIRDQMLNELFLVSSSSSAPILESLTHLFPVEYMKYQYKTGENQLENNIINTILLPPNSQDQKEFRKYLRDFFQQFKDESLMENIPKEQIHHHITHMTEMIKSENNKKNISLIIEIFSQKKIFFNFQEEILKSLNIFLNQTKTTSFYEQIRSLITNSGHSDARFQLAFTLISKNQTTDDINRLVFGHADLQTIIKKNKNINLFIQKAQECNNECLILVLSQIFEQNHKILTTDPDLIVKVLNNLRNENIEKLKNLLEIICSLLSEFDDQKLPYFEFFMRINDIQALRILKEKYFDLNTPEFCSNLLIKIALASSQEVQEKCQIILGKIVKKLEDVKMVFLYCITQLLHFQDKVKITLIFSIIKALPNSQFHLIIDKILKNQLQIILRQSIVDFLLKLDIEIFKGFIEAVLDSTMKGQYPFDLFGIVLAVSERVDDDKKRIYLEFLQEQKSFKQFFSLLFKMNDVNGPFFDFFLNQVSNAGEKNSPFLVTPQIFQQLLKENKNKWIDFLLHNVQSYDKQMLLDLVIQYDLQECKNLIVETIESYSRTTHSFQNVYFLMDIVQIQGSLLLTKEDILQLIEGKKMLEEENQIILLTLLKVLRVFYGASILSARSSLDYLGEFKQGSYTSLKILSKCLRGNSEFSVMQNQITKTATDCLVCLSKIKFKPVSNILFKFNKNLCADLDKNLESLNDILSFTIGRLLVTCPDKSQKCVKFIHLHLQIIYKLLILIEKFESKKKNEYINRINEIIHLYGLKNLSFMLISASQQLRNGSLQHSILNTFTRLILENYKDNALDLHENMIKLVQYVHSKYSEYTDDKQKENNPLFFLISKTLQIDSFKKLLQLTKNTFIFFQNMTQHQLYHKCLEQCLLTPSQKSQNLSKISSLYLIFIKLQKSFSKLLGNKNDGIKEKKIIKMEKIQCTKIIQSINDKLPTHLYLEVVGQILSKPGIYNAKSSIIEQICEKLNQNSSHLRKKDYSELKNIIITLNSQWGIVQNESSGADKQKDNKSFLKFQQQIIFLMTTITSIKQNLISTIEDSHGILENLLSILSRSESFVIRNSVIFMVVLFSEHKKYKILENLGQITQELFYQMLVLINLKGYTSQETLNQVLQQYAQYNQEEYLEYVKKNKDIQKNHEGLSNNASALLKLLLNSLSQLVKSMNNLMKPYLNFIANLMLILEIEDSPIFKFYDELSESLETRVLLTLNSLEFSVQLIPIAVRRAAFLFQKIFMRIKEEDVEMFQNEMFKGFLKFVDYTRINFFNKQNLDPEIDGIENLQIEAYCTLVLKLNEIQFKKQFMNLVTWSERKFPEEGCGFGFTEYRKIIFTKIVIHLFGKLGNLFTQFFSFHFDNIIQSLQQFGEIFTPIDDEDSKKKRKFTQEDNFKNYKIILAKCQLKALELLFDNDQNEFLDTKKFEALLDPLLDIYGALKMDHYSQFVEDSLINTVSKLFNLTSDDFKLKTLNYNLLQRTRNDEKKVKLAILKTVMKSLELLQERYIVLVNDLLPFITETLHDVDIQVEKISKEIIIQLENLSGENIRDYFKNK